MANPLIARPQTASADLQAATLTTTSVPNANPASAKGQEQLAAKKDFDAALDKLTQGQTSADPKTTVRGQVEQKQAEQKQAAIQSEEKNKKQVSEQAGAQVAVSVVPPTILGALPSAGTVQAAAAQATAAQSGVQAVPAKTAQNTAKDGGKTAAKDAAIADSIPGAKRPAPILQKGEKPSAATELASKMQATVQAADAAHPELAAMMAALDDQSIAVPNAVGLQDLQYDSKLSPAPETGKAGVARTATAQAQQRPTAVASALSNQLATDDYLNLRSLQPASLKKATAKPGLVNANEGQVATAGTMMVGAGRDRPAPHAIVDAPVTTGGMQKPILSHDAIHQLTSQVSLLNQAKQDGEIKIRLKPDHLGELNMSIKNHGQQISVRIQAHDPEARRIIESSLSTLKDSLSQQNLTVTRMEVTQAPTAPQAHDGSSMQMDLGQFRQQSSDLGFQQQQQQESLANREYWREEESGRPRPISSASAARARPSVRSSEGLDLIA